MKIAVSATGNTMESPLDQRFGRAASFIIVETKTMDYEAIDNAGQQRLRAEPVFLQHNWLQTKACRLVITGNVGPQRDECTQSGKYRNI